MDTSNLVPPCVLHEDEHLLVVNKPAGWNTHAPSPFAGEGIYDWLKHREPRWANLAIIHRLDKETSGVLVFGKTSLANRSLTEQFASRAARKTYVLLSDRKPRESAFVVKSRIIRVGERYASGPAGEPAETRFEIRNHKSEIQGHGVRVSGTELIAEPLTGRTHQIRVHAAERGFPILGDTLYGGAPFPRVCLHAAELQFRHPVSGDSMKFNATIDFGADARLALRSTVIDPKATDAFRIIHGASDGWPGWYADRLGEYLLSQSRSPLSNVQRAVLDAMPRRVYHKILSRHVRKANTGESSPQSVLGEPAPERFVVRENEVKFDLSFN